MTTQDRIDAAEVRACGAHRRVQQAAQRLMDELDDVTDTAIPRVELSDEDSMVIVLKDGISQQKKVAAG